MASTRWGAIATAEAPEGSSDEKLPRGKFLARVKFVMAKTTSTGKSMWSVLFECIDGGPYNGQVAWNNFVYSPESPQALYFFGRDMEALGLPQSWFMEADPSDEEVKGALEASPFEVFITIGPDKKDKTRDVITKIEPAGEGTTSPTSAPTAPASPKASVSVPTPKATPAAPANARPKTPFG